MNPKPTIKQMALEHGLSPKTLSTRLRSGLTLDEALSRPICFKKFTDAQLIEVETYGLTISKSAYLMGVSPSAVLRRIVKLGITWRGKGVAIDIKNQQKQKRQKELKQVELNVHQKKPINGRTYWTQSEVNFLLNNHGVMKRAEIAQVLGKKESSVKSKISRLYERVDNKQ
jgi:DNA-binding CsgD family transcriptional regulator